MTEADWRMDAMAEFFNVKFVRIGKDGEPVNDTKQGNEMTQAQEDLVYRVAELADQFACGAAGEPVVYALHGPMDFAEEVIELVTAARDADATRPEPDADATEAVAKAIMLARAAIDGMHGGHGAAGDDPPERDWRSTLFANVTIAPNPTRSWRGTRKTQRQSCTPNRRLTGQGKRSKILLHDGHRSHGACVFCL